MAGLYDILTRKKPKSAAEELNKQPEQKPAPGGLGGKVSTIEIEQIRPGFAQYKADGGDLDWEGYVDSYKKTGATPKP